MQSQDEDGDGMNARTAAARRNACNESAMLPGGGFVSIRPTLIGGRQAIMLACSKDCFMPRAVDENGFIDSARAHAHGAKTTLSRSWESI